MSRRPFKVLQLGREHLLVFHPADGEDRMVLVDRVNEDHFDRRAAEEKVVDLHRRRDVLNGIYRQWGPPSGGGQEQTVPGVPGAGEGEA